MNLYFVKYLFLKIKKIIRELNRRNKIMEFRPKYINTKYPCELKWGERVIYLCEIKNMPGHCIVLSCSTSEIKWGFHVGDFILLEDDEV